MRRSKRETPLLQHPLKTDVLIIEVFMLTNSFRSGENYMEFDIYISRTEVIDILNVQFSVIETGLLNSFIDNIMSENKYTRKDRSFMEYLFHVKTKSQWTE